MTQRVPTIGLLLAALLAAPREVLAQVRLDPPDLLVDCRNEPACAAVLAGVLAAVDSAPEEIQLEVLALGVGIALAIRGPWPKRFCLDGSAEAVGLLRRTGLEGLREIHPRSECVPQSLTREITPFRHRVTGAEATVIGGRVFDRQGDDGARIEATVLCSGLCGLGYQCRVGRVDGRWRPALCRVSFEV